MSTKPFSCPWDSGQVGWIHVSLSKVREEYGVKRVTKKIREQAISMLEQEVEEYSQYLSGEIYGYVIEDKTGRLVDSCWGFYGSDPQTNGMLETIPAKYHDLVLMVS